MKKYAVVIGTPDNLKQIDSEIDRETLVEAASVYEAHKIAMGKCKGIEEVLRLTHNGVRVYDIATGFTPDE